MQSSISPENCFSEKLHFYIYTLLERAVSRIAKKVVAEKAFSSEIPRIHIAGALCFRSARGGGGGVGFGQGLL